MTPPWPGPTHPTGPAGPGPSPTHPQSAPPPGSPPPPPSPPSDDLIFLTVALLRLDLARRVNTRPPSKPPRKPINTRPIRFSLPRAKGVPSFGGRS